MTETPAPPSPQSGGGCISRLLRLLLISGLGAAVYFMSQPQDLSTVETSAPLERDVKTALDQAIQNKTPLTLTEGEINRWLAKTLVTRQGGLFDDKVSLDQVVVRLENERAEIIMARRCFGHPFTVSMYVKIERSYDAMGPLTTVHPSGGPYVEDFPQLAIGGRFGQLTVPQGFLHLVMPAYQQLAAEFSEEIHIAVVKMAKLRIEPQKLILDPREPLGNLGMPNTF
jgi:hypothetical protein